MRCLCRHHCHCHCAGERGTGDDVEAKASLSALLLPPAHMSVRHWHCHCYRTGEQGTGDAVAIVIVLRWLLRRHRRNCTGKRGTVDDAEASLPALSPLLMRTCVCAAAATAIAIAWASEGQVMMPRHHRLPCCCR